MTMRTYFIIAIAACMLTCGLPAHAEQTTTSDNSSEKASQDDNERLTVTDPYIELHTGPGRGYPVFYVATRGQTIALELRHTDWYKVHTENGKIGWVNRAQLASTLTTTGEKKSFRDIVVDDYLSRRVQLGAAWGHFNSEPMLKIWSSYRLSDTLSVEGTVGQIQGTFAGADFWHINVVTEPWSDQRISPFFSIGLGKFKNYPNQSLVNPAPTDSQLATASIGARYYLTDRFILRSDYSIYTDFVSDDRTRENRAFSVGLSFFF